MHDLEATPPISRLEQPRTGVFKRANRKCAIWNAAPVSAQRAAGRLSWPVSHSRASRRLNPVASVSLTCAAQEEIPQQRKNILTGTASGSRLIGSRLSNKQPSVLCFLPCN